MRKIVEVLRLHLKLNLSLRQSATLLKISLGTASNYVNRFKELNPNNSIRFKIESPKWL